MRPVNIKKLNYKDEVARRNRRIFILRIVVMVLGTIAVIMGIIYLLFFSRMFDVREVSFNGLDTVSSDKFRLKIDENLNEKILKFLPRRNNIFFVNTGNFEKEFASEYPIFKSVNIQRKLLHGLVLDFLERKPAGIWCFNPPVGGDCSYFDDDKVLWGQPAKSSGFIFLTIEDRRETTDKKIDEDFFKPITRVVKSMTGEIKNIIIPADSFNEFRVYTTDYYIIFITDSDIQNQLDTLKIFMNEKNKDSNFHPQYIDLRIDGRVYYK
jgi:cell division septal protein FtsQ